MGNDLHLLYDGVEIANLGRKASYSIVLGEDKVPTREEIENECAGVRSWLMAKLVAYSTYMLVKDVDDITEELNDLTEKMESYIDYFEKKIMTAGMNAIIKRLEQTENLEIVDDYEFDKRHPDKSILEDDEWDRENDEYLDRQNRQ